VIGPRLGRRHARLASAIGRVRAAERRAVRAPARARAEILGELLLASERHLPGVLERAADLGLAVAGWHAVARVTPAAQGAPDGAALMDAALDAVAATGLPWHAAGVESTLVFARSWPTDPGGDGAAFAEAGALLAELRGAIGGESLLCGIAGPRRRRGPTHVRTRGAGRAERRPLARKA
jgi:GNAT superfamily N-acetyltransferase